MNMETSQKAPNQAGKVDIIIEKKKILPMNFQPPESCD
jgi:hypothetical protein